MHLVGFIIRIYHDTRSLALEASWLSTFATSPDVGLPTAKPEQGWTEVLTTVFNMRTRRRNVSRTHAKMSEFDRLHG